MTAQEDLALFAQTRGIGTVGVNIFAGVEPDKDIDPVVTFYNVGAELPVYVYGQRKAAITTPRVRVWARSRVYGQALALAERLYDLLQQTNVRVGTTMYLMLRPLSEPMPLGPDANNRQQVGFSIRTRRSG